MHRPSCYVTKLTVGLSQIQSLVSNGIVWSFGVLTQKDKLLLDSNCDGIKKKEKRGVGEDTNTTVSGWNSHLTSLPLTSASPGDDKVDPLNWKEKHDACSFLSLPLFYPLCMSHTHTNPRWLTHILPLYVILSPFTHIHTHARKTCSQKSSSPVTSHEKGGGGGRSRSAEAAARFLRPCFMDGVIPPGMGDGRRPGVCGGGRGRGLRPWGETSETRMETAAGTKEEDELRWTWQRRRSRRSQHGGQWVHGLSLPPSHHLTTKSENTDPRGGKTRSDQRSDTLKLRCFIKVG